MMSPLVFSSPSRGVAAVACLMTMTAAATAEVPRVVTDIPPVQGLVTRVMQGVGEPSLLVRPGASPHSYALRPSEAAALEAAQAVFFVGPELTPWLMRPIETLSAKATHVELLAAPGTVVLDSRDDPLFAHGEEQGHDPDNGSSVARQAHADHAHSHDGIDPHAWLDPENGKAWTQAIAAELARLDPDHADAYRANAAAAVAEIDAAETDTRAALAPLGAMRFVVFHDAYQYAEQRFGLRVAGAVSPGDATTPSPSRIAALRDAVAAMDAGCALAEPQFDPDLLNTVAEGTDIRTAVIDPIGADIPPGPGFYPALIRSLGTALQACR